MLQNFCGPLVQALARSLCGYHGATMDFGGNTKQQFARGWFLRGHSTLLAVGQMVLDRHLKLSFQFCDGLAVKADDAANAQNSTDEDVVALVKLNSGGISLVSHGVHVCAETLAELNAWT